ncbi:uncharacterized protein LOC111083971 [Limulus polyphemus]|uniref:Uncharacterized protein LOC111083971 n=1 Tax=Limulus polyphemus TaxID=6850 RepID=A0ABM1RYH9_LIMPO|nr:uncharacterized protein LOC111083971 [Limulus polyphemus]
MIGGTGSRHLCGRRRSSSPDISSHHRYLSPSKPRTHDEEKEDEKLKKNVPLHRSTRLSPQRMISNRRRASNHKSCTFKHSQFEGMTLEEVALRALSAEAAGRNEDGGLTGPRTLVQAMAQRKATPAEKTPTSLFVLKEDNIIRRYTKFVIEWPYPLMLL